MTTKNKYGQEERSKEEHSLNVNSRTKKSTMATSNNRGSKVQISRPNWPDLLKLTKTVKGRQERGKDEKVFTTNSSLRGPRGRM